MAVGYQACFCYEQKICAEQAAQSLLFFQIMCKGNIVNADTHTQFHDEMKKQSHTTRPLVERFDIKFQVTMAMVPSCRVMVYYVRKDKEVVVDSVNVDVEDKLENQVKATRET